MAVINQQLLDAVANHEWSEPNRREGESDEAYDRRRTTRRKSWQQSLRQRDDARRWLKDERAIRNVCDIAGISYEHVQRKVKQIEENQWQPIGTLRDG